MAIEERGHPDTEELAQYTDDRLDAGARSEIERHLAECADCRAIVIETMAFLASDAVDRKAAGVPSATANGASGIPARRRVATPTKAMAAVLAVAALSILAVRVVPRIFGNRSGTGRALQQLVAAAALEPTRPVAGRLSGGFKYGPAPAPSRGPAGSEPSPKVRIAAAQLEEAARADGSAANRAALGVAYLVQHHFDRAIVTLELAVQQERGNARFQNDLAAAYLERATWEGRSDALPQALAAAERAIAIDSSLNEAYFNRALALEGLHLDARAADAWSAYVARDPSGPWSQEAAARAAAIKARPISGASDPHRSNQTLREHIEDELLTRWGTAILARDTRLADAALQESQVGSRELADASGDTMALDEVGLIQSALAAKNQTALRSLAQGHAAYGRARSAFVNDRLQDASEAMTDAASHFERARSAYASWAPVYRAIALRIGGSAKEALSLLGTVQPPSAAKYFNFRGRLAWTRAAALQTLGRFDQAKISLHDAIAQFAAAGEVENLTINQMGLAEAEWYLGEKRGMWTDEIDALARLGAVRSPPRRNALLLEAATFALADDLPEAALNFQDALLDLVQVSPSPLGLADAYRGRARILGRLSRLDEALSDADTAERFLAAVPDRGLFERSAAEIARVRAELLTTKDPEQAAETATQALTYARENGYAVRAAELLTIRAQAYAQLRDDRRAGDDFRAAIDALDAMRFRLGTMRERMQALAGHQAAVQGLIALEGSVLRHPEIALHIAEQGRARALLDGESQGAEPSALDPNAVRSRIPRNTLVVYYAALPETVIVWTITRDRTRYFTRPWSAARLDAVVRQMRGIVEQNTDFPSFVGTARPLSDDLVLPALDAADGRTRVVFVPDGPLADVPFGVLPDRQGRPLLLAFNITVAPSFNAFLNSSARLAGFAPQSVLAIGDGHQVSAGGPPLLPHADEEAVSVGRLYGTATVLTGNQATATEFFAAERDVIHFAGHSISNPEFPMFSRLLLAPDRERGDGVILASDLIQHRLAATRVVVLASCEGARGKTLGGEGSLSIARAFMQAGAASVVASLWTVGDAVNPVLIAFHRKLTTGLDPGAALRASQVEWLRDRGWNTPLKQWGGFVALGGIDPTAP